MKVKARQKLVGLKILVHICARNQKQRIMKHRQFKTECLCMTVIKEKTFRCKDIREVKKKIYLFGTREEKYRVDVIDKNTGEINDIYLMKYTKEGPIFSKQTYSRWKYRDWETDRKSTRLNSSHSAKSRMPSSA